MGVPEVYDEVYDGEYLRYIMGVPEVYDGRT